MSNWGYTRQEMKIHRFYTPNIKLEHDFWFKDEQILHQWVKVLRFRPGQKVVLFDGVQHDKLYKIEEIASKEVKLVYVTDYVRKQPSKEIYLFWSLLKKDKNDWVLQKCTELGVSHFIPLIADRSEKTGFNIERARKIVIEASEQCGRSDLPSVRQPLKLTQAIEQYFAKTELYICEQSSQLPSTTYQIPNTVGVLVGPEGGWSDTEKQLFIDQQLKHLNLHDFTLRAETACLAAVHKLIQ